MSNTQKDEKDFYVRLKEELTETSKWPSDYLYKFIIPNNEEKVKELEEVFKGTTADIKTKESSNGKYVSYSISLRLENPDAVIDYYKKAGKIEGIISL